jgi:hypothetical protein
MRGSVGRHFVLLALFYARSTVKRKTGVLDPVLLFNPVRSWRFGALLWALAQSYDFR